MPEPLITYHVYQAEGWRQIHHYIGDVQAPAGHAGKMQAWSLANKQYGARWYYHVEPVTPGAVRAETWQESPEEVAAFDRIRAQSGRHAC